MSNKVMICGINTSNLPHLTEEQTLDLLLQAKNGNEIYAKTNVCAIEISEYETYLESQSKNHKN